MQTHLGSDGLLRIVLALSTWRPSGVEQARLLAGWVGSSGNGTTGNVS
jgi:hypothetical protein